MIDVKTVDGIAVVTLVHGKANTLDTEFCDAVAKKFKELEASDARGVVLTGQGRMFSAGVDLVRLAHGGAAYVREFLPALHRLFEAVFFHRKPVIAAVNGHAIAGGAVLACCADRRVMAREGGRIGVTELQVGVPFPVMAFEAVRFAVPPRYLNEFILGASTYSSDEALTKGWVDEVVEPDALAERALAVARQYAALSPAAFALSKRQIRQLAADNVRARKADDEAANGIWAAPETLNYIKDYVAKTLKK
ncbi:MAG TPA: enoyl-CoA hydratase/isomerase family protein [Pseudolabrys sp.]|jgi:enoyl-CoA hydratase|nr:enoyl-CoA hydratase/isomerase family protein [Pseudolabrys sp.]